MPVRDADEQRLLRAFLEDAEDLLEKLNSSMLELDRNENVPGSINEVFRLIHSLKSEAALLGFTHLSELAHKLEDVFDGIRAGTISLNRSLMDAAFSAADLVHEMIGRISRGQGDGGLDGSSVIEALQRAAALEPGREQSQRPGGEPGELVLGDFQRAQILEARDRGEQIYIARVRVAEEAEMKYSRAYLVFNILEKLTNVIATIPDLSVAQEADEIYSAPELLLSTDLDPQLLSKSCNVDLIEEVKFSPWDEQAIAKAVASGQDRLEEAREAGPAGAAGRALETSSVRVATKKLNEIWQLVAELIINKAQFSRFHSSSSAARESNRGEIARAADSLDRIATEMQQAIMETRMVPIAVLFNKFPRLVRDLSRKLGKNAELEIQGKETEIDRTVVEALSDPLTHIIRNSLDHGLESPEERRSAGKGPTGKIIISAQQQGGKVVIEVRDDGLGLDVEKIRKKAGAGPELSDEQVIQNIFSPGFSTKDGVTDLSGRGVGLDVVATRIREDLKGEVEVRSERGRGTLVRILLPLTMTILHSLIVSSSGFAYAIPVQDIDEAVKIMESEIRSGASGGELYSYAGTEIPLLWLGALLQDGNVFERERKGEYSGVIIRQRQSRACLLVDELVEEEDVVIKPISPLLNMHRLFSGVSVLGDGRILFILDTARIIELSATGGGDGH